MTLVRGLALAAVLGLVGREAMGQKVATWWPDPNTGVMWDNRKISEHTLGRTFLQEQAEYSQSRSLGYSDWRLPTLAEADSATEDITIEGCSVGPHLRCEADPGVRRVLSSQLKFNSYSLFPMWTTTLDTQGLLTPKKWTPPGVNGDGKPTDRGFPSFCVRTMEPDLLELAKQGHPSIVITGLPQLKSIILLVQAEDAMDHDDFEAAIPLARQAIVLDPRSARAFLDIGTADAYLGNFADALSNLKSAHGYDKTLTQPALNTKWVKSLEKEVPNDPKALPTWVLVHDADVAVAAEQWDAAMTAANQVIAQEPDWPQGYHRLGLALGALARKDEAIAALTKAEGLDKHKETRAKVDLKDLESGAKK